MTRTDTFDQCMTWGPHIAIVVCKCHAILLSLYKIRHYFVPKILELLVQAHVFPTFNVLYFCLGRSYPVSPVAHSENHQLCGATCHWCATR